jgi:ADP-ribosylglycohydrolase
MLDPQDYVERVYAGVLGKIIGVYLGRPIESWSYQKIQKELGEISYYVHERLGQPLVVSDDDISGTFTFVRAMADYGCQRSITAEQIGRTWLNYIVEKKTILWWGGFGQSTEHTAFLRLKSGIPAPKSGSIATNGKTIAEQIGAQIFIDGWALIAPANPALAVELAGKAASVSHDGEAVHAAQLIAAMESQAFVEPSIDTLIEKALSYIPANCLISRLADDVRAWSSEDGDWHLTRERIEKRYGYEKFSGNCHVVPNHALILLGLLYSEDDFQRALTIVNTSGWDTDCNSGNVGCLMGIKNGLPGLERGPDFRSPVADQLYLPTADGGRCITDAVRETYALCQTAAALGQIEPITIPKHGARFHFDLPGATQGFVLENGSARGGTSLRNMPGHSESGKRSLAWQFNFPTALDRPRTFTPTFLSPLAKDIGQYALTLCPTLFSGQRVTTRWQADATNSTPVELSLFVTFYDGQDNLSDWYGPSIQLAPGESRTADWSIDDLDGAPIARFGFELRSAGPASGTLYLDYVDWKGAPNASFHRPAVGGEMWRHAWVNAFETVGYGPCGGFHLSQGRGTGLFIQGGRDWKDYFVQTTIVPRLAKIFGLAARVQGLTRYYALLFGPGQKLRLVRALDGIAVLAERPFPWIWERPYKLGLEVIDTALVAWVDEQEMFRLNDRDSLLNEGGVAFLCEEGLITSDELVVEPTNR